MPATVWSPVAPPIETVWTPADQPGVGTTKPVIAGIEMEYDVRTLTALPQADYSVPNTWDDTSGNNNDATQTGAVRRFELRGWGGDEPAVRLPTNFISFSYDGTVLENTEFTQFAVIHALSIADHYAVMGSSVSGPFPRFPYILIRSDGSVVYTHGADPYNIRSAAGVVVAGSKYVISTRFSSTGMILRVNGVQVGADATALQAILDNQGARIGEIRDGLFGGLLQVFGIGRQLAWASAYSSAASDDEMDQMERFLADRFDVPGLKLVSPKPVISSPEFEFDVITLRDTADGASITTWTDSSGQSNDATAVGIAFYEPGAWSDDILEALRLLAPSGSYRFDGTVFIGSDVTIFLVYRMISLAASSPWMGGPNFGDNQQIEIYAHTNGRVVFSFGTDEGAIAVEAPPGTVVADGSCHVLTCRFSQSDGKLIRLDGIQVAIKASSTAPLTSFSGASLFDVAGGILAVTDVKQAWISGYSVAASGAEMSQMEAFLLETFCQEVAPPTAWLSCHPDPLTPWAACPSP